MASNRHRLTDEQRAFIVEQIACFATPTEAALAVYQEFGVEINAHNVEKYDYTKQAGKRCAKKWHALYDVTRKAFLKHIEERVPHAHKAVRVKKLANASDVFERAGNYVAMAGMLEKIAKECGGAYTNRFEHTGKDGGAIKVMDVDQMTEEQCDDEMRRLGFDPDVHAAPTTTQ